jgi:hypothetical protein
MALGRVATGEERKKGKKEKRLTCGPFRGICYYKVSICGI